MNRFKIFLFTFFLCLVNSVFSQNTAPVATNFSHTATWDNLSLIPVIPNHVTDADGDSLTLKIVNRLSSLSNASVGFDYLNYSYYNDFIALWARGNNGNSGTDTLDYSVCDTKGACDTGSIYLTVLDYSANSQPNLTYLDTFVYADGSSIYLDANRLATDPENDSLIIYAPNVGQQKLVNNKLEYTAAANNLGLDTLIYYICDARGACSYSYSSSINVAPENYVEFNLPDVTVNTPKNNPIDLSPFINRLGSNGDSLNIMTWANQPKHGYMLRYSTNLLYTPKLNFVGIDTVKLLASDSFTSRFIRVFVNVEAISDTSTKTATAKLFLDSLMNLQCNTNPFPSSGANCLFYNDTSQIDGFDNIAFDSEYRVKTYDLEGKIRANVYYYDYEDNWSADDSIVYTYDAKNRLYTETRYSLVEGIRVWEENSATRYYYNNKNDLDSVTRSGVTTLKYEYIYENGKKTKVTSFNGANILLNTRSYFYDSKDSVSKVIFKSPGKEDIITDIINNRINGKGTVTSVTGKANYPSDPITNYYNGCSQLVGVLLSHNYRYNTYDNIGLTSSENSESYTDPDYSYKNLHSRSNCFSLGDEVIVKGKVYQDLNSNGAYDAGEEMSGVKVDIDDRLRVFSDLNGNYSLTGIKDQNSVVRIPNFIRKGCNGNIDIIYSSLTNSYSLLLDTIKQNIDFIINQPVDSCVTICGSVWSDANKNGIKDLSELAVDEGYLLLNSSQIIPVNLDGTYCFDSKIGNAVNLQLKLPSHNLNYYCSIQSSDSSFVTFPNNSVYNLTVTESLNNLDFGVSKNSKANHTVNIVSLRMSRGTVPGKKFRGWMDIKTIGTLPSDCKLKLSYDPYVTHIGSSTAPVNVKSNGFEFDKSTGAFDADWNCIGFEFKLSDQTPYNYELTWSAEFTCPDDCPGNDSIKRTFTTISSGGSNFKKAVLNENYQSVYQLDLENTTDISSKDSVFSYVIDFKNTTGHTVHNMVIMDTLSPYLDIKSLSTPFSSLPYKLAVDENNVLRFEFTNLNLPDESDIEINSYGFVQFNIKMKPNLPKGTEIVNKVGIVYNYQFDEPVRVNKLTSIIDSVASKDTVLTSCYGIINGAVSSNSKSLANGKVVLYTSGGNFVKEVNLTNGSYAFKDILKGGYRLYASATHPDFKLIPEYYNNSLNWDNAQTIDVTCNTNTIANFDLDKELVLSGSSKVLGVVGNGSVPKEGVKLFLMLNGNVLQTTTTNSNGEFEFANVPSGSFELKVDAVGAESITKGIIVSQSNSEQNQNFCVLGSSISDCEEPTGIEDLREDKIKFTAYPNPFENEVTIQFELQEQGSVELVVLNTLGQRVDVLLKGEQQAGVHQVKYTSNKGALIYVLQLTIDNQIYYKRISKTK